MSHPVVPTQRVRTLHTREPLAHGGAFVSSASGLARVGEHLIVAADDAHHLVRFPLTGHGAGELVRVLDGALPVDAAERKRQKPDFEAIIQLPACDGQEHGAALIIGSGSTLQREVAVLIELTPTGGLGDHIQRRPLAPLFDALRATCGELNIESAVIVGSDLLLISRANGSSPDNHVARFPLDTLSAWRCDPTHISPITPRSIEAFPVGTIDGVPLGVTDAAPHPCGGWVFAAVGEDTLDSYNDGALVGAVVGRVDDAGAIVFLGRLTPTAKIEGVIVTAADTETKLLMVTDADDPSRPAELLSATLPV